MDLFVYGMLAGLFTGGVITAIVWHKSEEKLRKSHLNERIDHDREVSSLGQLILLGWEVKSISSCIKFWELEAPDEDAPRRFPEAVTRQQKLNEIKKYNLPKGAESIT